VQFIARRAGADLVIDEHHIDADEIVFLMTGGANRDPQRFERPDRLDFARPKNRHLSFGQGPHYCIGAALARLEAQIALSTLIEKAGGICAQDAEPCWSPNPALRGLSKFPVLTGRASQVPRQSRCASIA
jgi:cytochrome P450